MLTEVSDSSKIIHNHDYEPVVFIQSQYYLAMSNVQQKTQD